MLRPFRSYKRELLKDLTDPREAAAYLTVALHEGSREEFLLALRNVAEAHGISTLATKAKLSRESLYRTLSARGNPRLSSLEPLLDKMGLRLTVAVKKQIPA